MLYILYAGLLEGSVLSPFLFCLALSAIWELFPPPLFPSGRPFHLCLHSVWILAYADDLAVVCASSVRLSRCLKSLSDLLKQFSL
jgi:hypothetical protein